MLSGSWDLMYRSNCPMWVFPEFSRLDQLVGCSPSGSVQGDFVVDMPWAERDLIVSHETLSAERYKWRVSEFSRAAFGLGRGGRRILGLGSVILSLSPGGASWPMAKFRTAIFCHAKSKVMNESTCRSWKGYVAAWYWSWLFPTKRPYFWSVVATALQEPVGGNGFWSGVSVAAWRKVETDHHPFGFLIGQVLSFEKVSAPGFSEFGLENSWLTENFMCPVGRFGKDFAKLLRVRFSDTSISRGCTLSLRRPASTARARATWPSEVGFRLLREAITSIRASLVEHTAQNSING